MTNPSISFVIPVRNDARRLERCLQAIHSSQVDSAKVEIVVADNGSTDGSCQVAQNAGAQVLSLPDLKVTALRNRAAATVSGDVLAFCDSDNLISPNWVETACELLEDPTVGGVGAPYSAPEPGTWVQRTYDGLRDHHPGTTETRWLGAGNLAIRTELFATLGGFDESLTTCEDVDICNRIWRSGKVLLSDSRLRSVHLGDPRTLRELFLGELWRGRDNLRVTLRGDLVVSDLPSLIAPIVDLVLVGSCLVGLALAPFGGLVVSALSMGMLSLQATLRALFILKRSERLKGWRFLQAFAVSLTYDLARALSLLWPIEHHRNLKE